VIRAIIWLYCLVATIVIGFLGLALLVSSAFAHAFVSPVEVRPTCLMLQSQSGIHSIAERST